MLEMKTSNTISNERGDRQLLYMGKTVIFEQSCTVGEGLGHFSPRPLGPTVEVHNGSAS